MVPLPHEVHKMYRNLGNKSGSTLPFYLMINCQISKTWKYKAFPDIPEMQISKFSTAIVESSPNANLTQSTISFLILSRQSSNIFRYVCNFILQWIWLNAIDNLKGNIGYWYDVIHIKQYRYVKLKDLQTIAGIALPHSSIYQSFNTDIYLLWSCGLLL